MVEPHHLRRTRDGCVLAAHGARPLAMSSAIGCECWAPCCAWISATGRTLSPLLLCAGRTIDAEEAGLLCAASRMVAQRSCAAADVMCATVGARCCDDGWRRCRATLRRTFFMVAQPPVGRRSGKAPAML
ncbi:U-box domain-containing protein 28-like [Dorcoceras hygrometricum]|uniref:U-box domain-containing protein 28-like n=1 Tax=Dorcoceras hygrometricum TaxID=472368 RepID=A0A2Z7AUX5_9LAMI|nr:U-box domain-containing protein 28-like [Dorcoceras hygrometricum]